MKGSIENREQQQKWISDDILMNILSRIPARSVVRLRSVCKHWRALTHQPHFINMHLSRVHRHAPSVLIKGSVSSYKELRLCSIDDADPCSINVINTIYKYNNRVSSKPCNGLICLAGETDIVVLNLATQESITIPNSSRMNRYGGAGHIVLAFQPSANKYILIWYDFDGHDSEGKPLHIFEVLTLGSKTWRMISTDDACSTISNMSTCCRFINNGVSVDGIVYYLMDVEGHGHVHGIVSLDLEDWTFRDVTFPCSPLDEYSCFYFHLHILHGNLCLMKYHGKYYEPAIDIWVLKDHPVKGVWSREYQIFPPSPPVDGVCWTRSFLTVHDGYVLLHEQGVIIFCAIGKQEFEFIHDDKLSYCSIYAYDGTLVDLKSLAC